MSGKKGRSGRRPLSVEMKRHAVIDKAWALLDDNLGNKAIDVERRMDIARSIAVKDMPSEITGDIINTQVVLWHNGKEDKSTD